MQRKTLIIGGLWTSYGAVAAKGLALIGNLFLARLLLPSEFGVISIAYIFWGLANLFSTAGAFIVYKGTEDKRYLNTTYTISISVGLILTVILSSLSPLIARFFNVPDLTWILCIFAVNLLFSFAQSVYVGVLTRRLQYQEMANINLFSSLIRLLVTVSFALIGFGYWSFAIGDTTFWVISCALNRHYTKHNFKLQIDSEVKSEIISFYLGAVGFNLGFYINSNCDNFLIGKILGSASLGFYNFAYQLTMALTNILGQISDQLITPLFAKIPDDKKQESALAKSVEQVAFVVAPIYALFYLLIDQQAITFIFGEKWLPACAMIPWLLIFGYFRLINGLLSSMLFAKGQPGVNAKINLHIAPIAVIGFFLGAHYGGVLGVSISVAITLGIFWTIYWWLIGCRELNWSLNKFLISIFKPAFLVFLAVLTSLQIPIYLRPFTFTFAYCLLMYLTANDLFLQYRSFTNQLFTKIVSITISK